ncbi:MAG: [FeFe] hydrogenase H-cluster radical SAM maturase HydE [Rikenellaceae bacterium]
MVNFEDVVSLLLGGEETRQRAAQIKSSTVGDKVYLRGLIELSNKCIKNCLYCGIRSANKRVSRYDLSDEKVIEAARYAFERGYGSIAIQAGEQASSNFTKRITGILHSVKDLSQGELGVTLSLGEQSYDTLSEWRAAGADRYLMRIESSNKSLYKSIHPKDGKHSFERRVEVLQDLKTLSYQVGTGVMIGLPNQTIEDLAGDIMFFQDMDIDMCGMGPYIEHHDTPLYEVARSVKMMTLEERFELSLQMVATLRCAMPNVNIAATTALQAIHTCGREDALAIGANVLMPNITPSTDISNYNLYDNKPIREGEMGGGDEELFATLRARGFEIGLHEQGNSLHYRNKKRSSKI